MRKKFLNNLPFFFFVILGIFFRFYNLNWDMGNYFHPDERNIANAVVRIHFFSQLNPQFFAYGGFLIYLERAVGDLLVILTKQTAWIENWSYINIIGRLIGAFFSTATIPVIFLLTKKITNKKKTALFATCIAACTVGLIQIAHFGITENVLTFLAPLITLCAIKMYERKTFKVYAITAFLCGLAIATKTTAITFLIPPVVAFFLILTKEKKKYMNVIIQTCIFFVITFIVFFIFSPYTLLDYPHFLESMDYESKVALGTLPVPYTLQFNHTFPYLFQLKNFFWQLGIIAFCSYVGFILFLINTIKNRKPISLILLSFPLLYFLYVGMWHTKFVRFMLPIIPFLILWAAIFLEKLQTFKLLGNIIVLFFLGATFAWSLAFFSIYQKPQTRIIASEWIYNHVAPGSKILTEQWDDGLPIPVNRHTPNEYVSDQLTMYDPDTDSKMQYLASELSSADYLIFNSRRLYGTLIHLSDIYPLTSNYYQDVFNGKLGFKKVAQFSSYPTLLGVFINDDTSEETFQVYDHPKALIFKNEKRYSQEQLYQILSGTIKKP